MLYILPPPRTPNPPTPWESIYCGDGSGGGGVRTTWDNGNRKPPPSRARLRNEDGSLSPQDDNMDTNRNPKSLNECYFASKDTVLVLPAAEAQISNNRNYDVQDSNIRRHLQSIVDLLQPEETLKMAVKLESVHPNRIRYLVIVSREGKLGEESSLLGIDCSNKSTVGLVLRVMADTTIRLDGDGGFSVSVYDRHHIFKPVSVQAMWSALQTLHKVSSNAHELNYYQVGTTHTWVGYYEDKIESDQSCRNEWNAMDNIESRRPPSPDSIRTKPTEREQTERVIRATLKEIMMSVDLDEVTSKYIRTRLEEDLNMDLGEFKSFIDQEMLTILGQMDAPTRIFDHVYLGSEWNASNYEELERNGVGHILNVTREIDNFFPGKFDYLNVRVYDDEKTDLLKHWDDTFKYINKAKKSGSKVLVHCKMGVSRSASTVIAYAMKACNWDFQTAMDHVQEKRNCIKPNTSFISQLETYQGILDAMKNREKLQRSKSETNLKSPGGNKPDKILAGSKATPVVQALYKHHDLQTTLSGQDLRNLGSRPKSWSPDNSQVSAAEKSPVSSLSLEDLTQKLTCPLQARHVLMPCDNGESYSVSPNQILHLPASSVKERISELERSQITLNLAAHFEETPPAIWDPGALSQQSCYSTSDSSCDSRTDSGVGAVTAPCVWTCSTVLKTVPDTSSINLNPVPQQQESRAKDPFSNQLDRVFDREEKKQVKTAVVSAIDDVRECPSRQNSWSSYDSAVVMGSQTEVGLSRHSSWGSGDSRVLPSRESSWGSYDIRQRLAVPYINEKGERIVQRDDKKGRKSDSTMTKSSSSETLFEYADKPVGLLLAAPIEIPNDNGNATSCGDGLSASAPEQYSLELLGQECPLSRSESNVAVGSVVGSPQCSSVREHKNYLENLGKEAAKVAERAAAVIDNNAGIVKSLKKEFEAKTSEQPLVEKRVKNRPFIQSNARFSCLEPLENKAVVPQRRGDIEGEVKRPPISPSSRIVATVIKAAKSQAQFRKSHPVPRLPTQTSQLNPLYNTM